MLQQQASSQKGKYTIDNKESKESKSIAKLIPMQFTPKLFKFKCDLVINGYIHQNCKLEIPSEIVIVILHFYFSNSSFIKVYARIRPQNKREKHENGYIITKLSGDNKTVSIKSEEFLFEHIFDSNSSQSDIYDEIGPSFIKSIFNGINVSILNYGQLGAGKTFTMEGVLGSPHRGFMPRIVENIFQKAQQSSQDIEFQIKVSYAEIYMEKLKDLLHSSNSDNLKIIESDRGQYIEPLTEMTVQNAEEVIDLYTMGATQRAVAHTRYSAVSAKSHGIFMLRLEQRNTKTGENKQSVVRFYDLASTGFKMGKYLSSDHIMRLNKSLNTLTSIVSSLVEEKNDIEWNDSVLSRLLKEELNGNWKTYFIINMSPSSTNVEETITSCKFAQILRLVRNGFTSNIV